MLMIGIRQFFTCQNFPNPDSSKFSTIKILRHTVIKFLYVDTSKNGMHQKSFVNGHCNGDLVSNTSYQMPPSQIHHSHHQQNINV